MIDKIYNWFIYHKIMHDLKTIERAVIDSKEWYEKRDIFRGCINLEAEVSRIYKNGLDNMYISIVFCQVAKMKELIKEV